MYKAQDIAKWFLANEDCIPDEITNMKLQKLLYYAQGTFLAMTDKPLFDDDICKWPYGPVVPNVYYQYNSFGDRKITDYTNPPEVTETDDFLLHQVCELFGVHSAWQLSEMTHKERPWMITADGRAIDKKVIKNYFKENVFSAMLSGEIFESIPIVEGKRNDDGIMVFPAEHNDED